MKIVKLEAENIKRLVAVEIEPDGSLVQITGRNGAGKSSVLDAIWWALAGERGIQADPIRSGEQRARITLDLGELVVIREFSRRADDSTTTRLRVEAADGARYGSPQKMLDGLLGSLTFDPLAFQRSPARKQVEMLSGLCGIDIADVEAADREDYEQRREFGRVARSRRAAADAITVPADAPDERVDVGSLAAELRAAEAANREREGERRERDVQRERIENLRLEAGHAEDRIAEHRSAMESELRILERRLREVREQGERQMAAAVRDRDGKMRAAEEREAGLAALPPVEPDIDTSEIQQQIEQADARNRAVDARERRKALIREASEADRQAQTLTDRMDARRRETRDAIAAADLGIEGLTVASGKVMLGDHPFEQASDAERLRASCAIAMRGDAKLRVLRVRDGSLLDEDSLRLLGEMAEAADYQVWVEMVDTSGKVGIVIEDGQVRS